VKRRDTENKGSVGIYAKRVGRDRKYHQPGSYRECPNRAYAAPLGLCLLG